VKTRPRRRRSSALDPADESGTVRRADQHLRISMADTITVSKIAMAAK
jgi:hypothetical protein